MRVVAWTALVAAMVALWLSPRAGEPVARPGSAAGVTPAAADRVPALEAAAARPRRDLFRFGSAETAPSRAVPRRTLPEAEPPAASIGGPRLVGFIEQGDAVRAALAMEGRVVLVAPGEDVEGYSILRVDPDQGVTLRGPDGAELELPAR
jgi:hypothetical protein